MVYQVQVQIIISQSSHDDKKPTLNYCGDYQVNVLKKMVNHDSGLDTIDHTIKDIK